MQLTALATDELPRALEIFARGLNDPWAGGVFARIAATRDLIAAGEDLPEHRRRAVELAHAFGIATVDEAPARSFSWDGKAIRVDSEASVIVHEVAHWILCPVSRRGLPDFGLGAGPETGRRDAADALA